MAKKQHEGRSVKIVKQIPKEIKAQMFKDGQGVFHMKWKNVIVSTCNLEDLVGNFQKKMSEFFDVVYKGHTQKGQFVFKTS